MVGQVLRAPAALPLYSCQARPPTPSRAPALEEHHRERGHRDGDWATTTTNTQTPYNLPRALPGTIQAEHFDKGGEGIAYHETDTTNNGGAFRTTEGVDIQNTQDTGGGYDVGWTTGGEWLEYSVNVTTAGTYVLDARVASNGAGGTFHVRWTALTLPTP